MEVEMKRTSFVRFAGLAVIICAVGLAGAVGTATSAANWGQAQPVESVPGASPELNTAALEGCPFPAPDGLSLYFASNRAGGQGGLDIYVSQRASQDGPWGAPENVGAPVNSAADEFCPSPVQDGRFFFVSTRPGGCGGSDIYVTRPASGGGWDEPENLGCQVNSPGGEASPSLVDQGGDDVVLYFSGARVGGFAGEAEGAVPDTDIYYARQLSDGSFGHAILRPELSSAADDTRPNVRSDGLEIVFDSTRPGGLGGPDIWTASRSSVEGSWSTPVNLGPTVNSSAGETRATLTRSGDTLYFGSNREGGEGNSDVYVATRDGSAVTGTAASTAGAVTPPNTGDGGLRDGHSAPLMPVALIAAACLTIAMILRRTTAQHIS
jgi:hypothetical protein